MFKRIFLTALFAALTAFSSAFAGEISFSGTTDKNPFKYEPGEKIAFSVQCLEDGVAVSGKKLTWKRTGDDGKTESGEAVSDASNPLKIETSIDVPGFVRVQVFALDENGAPLEGEERQFNGGAGVLLDQIEGTPEPADFDEFWNRQKEILAQVPVKATLTPVDSGDENVLAFDVKVDCAGLAPVSGYLCLPKDAQEKSLPAQVAFHGYGVRTARLSPNSGRTKIYFNVNAHGILNGQSDEYYETLKKSTLASYGFSKVENSTPEKSYWAGMILRAMRALQFVKTLPEWNGEKLVVSGGSQGGFQSLVVAGLDSDVTEVQAQVPWFCDIARKENDPKIRGWLPEYVDGLAYFDATYHAKRIKGKVTISSGLGDFGCPPSGHVLLFRAIPTQKRWIATQGRTHKFTPQNAPEYVLQEKAR